MRRLKKTRRARGVAVVGAAAGMLGVLGVGGCLQILGDDGTFVGTGTGGGGGSTTTGGTGGTTGGTGGTTSSLDCTPNQTEPCYSGPDGTEGVGICKGGMRTCGEDGKWGACEGEQVPRTEDPAVVGDEACDGYASQEVVWSAVFGGDLAQGTVDVATDPTTGDVLVSGTYDSDGPIDILGTVLQPPAQAGLLLPGFLARFGPDGVLKSATGPTATLLNILVGPSGDVFVAGAADGNSPIGGQTLSGMFIGKLNGAGTFDWVRSCMCFLNIGMRAAFAKDGNLLIFGSFGGTLDWLGDGNSFTPVGGNDLLLSKLDISNGQVLWTKQLGGSNDDIAVGLALDPAGNIFIAGRFDGSFTDLGNKLVTSDGDGASSFVAKLSPSGEADWGVVLDGLQNQSIQAIAAGPGGEVVVAGSFDDTLKVHDTTVNESSVPGSGIYDLFVLKINASGEYQWGRGLGADYGFFTGLAVGDNGDIFGAGLYKGSVDLGGGPLPTAAANHGFLGRLTSNGDHVWSKDFGGAGDGFPMRLMLDATKLTVVATGDGAVDFADKPHITVGQDVAVAVIGR